MGYWELVDANRDRIIIKGMMVINNDNLQISFFITTNLHCDLGICNQMFQSYTGRSKKEYRRQLARYKQITGKKISLSGTDNDSGYTRLIYSLN